MQSELRGIRGGGGERIRGDERGRIAETEKKGGFKAIDTIDASSSLSTSDLDIELHKRGESMYDAYHDGSLDNRSYKVKFKQLYPLSFPI